MDLLLLHDPVAFLGAVRLEDAELAAEQVVDRVADVRLVVDDQQAVLGGGSCASPRSPRRGRSVDRGGRVAASCGFQGQEDAELGPLAGPALDLDPAAVPGDDPVADREAQAGPLAHRLGGEERVEQLGQRPRRRSRSRCRGSRARPSRPRGRVANRIRPPRAGPSTRSPGTALIRRLRITWLICEATQTTARHVAVLDDDLDVLPPEPAPDHLERRLDQVGDQRPAPSWAARSAPGPRRFATMLATRCTPSRVRASIRSRFSRTYGPVEVLGQIARSSRITSGAAASSTACAGS